MIYDDKKKKYNARIMYLLCGTQQKQFIAVECFRMETVRESETDCGGGALIQLSQWSSY